MSFFDILEAKKCQLAFFVGKPFRIQICTFSVDFNKFDFGCYILKCHQHQHELTQNVKCLQLNQSEKIVSKFPNVFFNGITYTLLC